MVDYESVLQFREDHERDIKDALTALEDRIIAGRDKKGVPIYLTKYRLKSADSLYLKMLKKDLDDPLDCSDLGGLRILCLFDQEIFPAFDFLISTILPPLRLSRFKIFNFHDKDVSYFKGHDGWSRYSNPPSPELPPKTSGYRSLHFLITWHVNNEWFPIEIQLRTLLQDVWGEVEHTLMYKSGAENPDVRSTFTRLQKDLGSMGEMLSGIKLASVKQASYDEFLMQYEGPDHFFKYEEDAMPGHFRDGRLASLFESYEKAASSRHADADIRNSCANLRNLLEQIRMAESGGVKLSQIRDNDLLYFFDAEEAYCTFAEGDLEKAAGQYKKIIEDHPGKYVPQFRLAEIFFIKGNMVKTLHQLAKAAEALQLDDLAALSSISLLNAYKIKCKTAYVYWLLGRDYVGRALEKITKAELVFDELQKREDNLLDPSEEAALANNVCWYKLEKFEWISDQPDVSVEDIDTVYKQAETSFARLKRFLGEEDVTSNALDTAAWFSYKSYLYKGEPQLLTDAAAYVRTLLGKRNRATFKSAVAEGRVRRLREISAMVFGIPGRG